jgi:hypothetical protein
VRTVPELFRYPLACVAAVIPHTHLNDTKAKAIKLCRRALRVRLIVKKRVGEFDTAHGLRSDFITTGAKLGASDRELMKTSRHRSTDRIGVYIRDAQIWDGTAHRRMED